MGRNISYYEGGYYHSRENGTIQSFEWIPHGNCSFEKWSTESFCRALKSDETTANRTSDNADIFVMGDSLSQEQYTALVQEADRRSTQSFLNDKERAQYLAEGEHPCGLRRRHLRGGRRLLRQHAHMLIDEQP